MPETLDLYPIEIPVIPEPETPKYQHNIVIANQGNGYNVSFSLINEESEAYTYNDYRLPNALNAIGGRIPASGIYKTSYSSEGYEIYALAYKSKNQITLYHTKSSASSDEYHNINFGGNIYDTVVAI